MRKLFGYLLPALVLLLSGCGYHISGTRGLPPAVAGKKIAVSVFANKSYRANVGAILAGSVADEFARRSGGMVASEESADLVLTGTVLTYTTSAVSYSAADKVKEYRAAMTVEATLTEKSTRKVIWKGVLSWSQDYPATTDVVLRQNTIVFLQHSSANIALQQNSEEAAIREISRKVALQLYQNISEGF